MREQPGEEAKREWEQKCEQCEGWKLIGDYIVHVKCGETRHKKPRPFYMAIQRFICKRCCGGQ